MDVVQKRVQMPDSDVGIFHVVDLMTERAIRDSKHPDVRRLALSLQGKTELGTAERCYNYVWNTIAYMKDADAATILKAIGITAIKNPRKTELLNSPKYTLFQRLPIGGVVLRWVFGDCDCMSMALASLLLVHRIPVNFKIIAHDSNDYTHVYCEGLIKEIGGWLPMDPVLRERGFGGEKGRIVRKKLFRVM